MKQALSTFRDRILDTLLGCAIGLLFVALGRTEWQLQFAMAVTVLISSSLARTARSITAFPPVGGWV